MEYFGSCTIPFPDYFVFKIIIYIYQIHVLHNFEMTYRSIGPGASYKPFSFFFAMYIAQVTIINNCLSYLILSYLILSVHHYDFLFLLDRLLCLVTLLLSFLLNVATGNIIGEFQK